MSESQNERIDLSKLTRDDLEAAVTFYRGKYEALLEVIKILTASGANGEVIPNIVTTIGTVETGNPNPLNPPWIITCRDGVVK